MSWIKTADQKTSAISLALLSFAIINSLTSCSIPIGMRIWNGTGESIELNCVDSYMKRTAQFRIFPRHQREIEGLYNKECTVKTHSQTWIYNFRRTSSMEFTPTDWHAIDGYRDEQYLLVQIEPDGKLFVLKKNELVQSSNFPQQLPGFPKSPDSSVDTLH